MAAMVRVVVMLAERREDVVWLLLLLLFESRIGACCGARYKDSAQFLILVEQ